uniref:Uncharacterized protein n=1 Tax=Arundo donax TaxID=35708 RepID=A0A0A9FUE0_ARUDO
MCTATVSGRKLSMYQLRSYIRGLRLYRFCPRRPMLSHLPTSRSSGPCVSLCRRISWLVDTHSATSHDTTYPIPCMNGMGSSPTAKPWPRYTSSRGLPRSSSASAATRRYVSSSVFIT